MKKVVLFDKNYVSLIKKLLGNQVATFWPINLKYSLINLIKACFFKFYRFNHNLKVLYLYFELKQISPDVIITFQDVNDNIIMLSRLLKNTRFIIVQDSYRPPGFYGKLKLKENDVLITYSPLVKFNLSKNEYSFRTFKYLNQKENQVNISDSIIFISQYRNYSNEKLKEVTKNLFSKISEIKIDESFDFLGPQEIFLSYVVKLFNKKGIELFFKSAFREGSKFSKCEEDRYFEEFGISEIYFPNIDLLTSTGNNIYLTIDSTMIFELLAFGQKVLIYPYRNIYINETMDPHIKILKDQYPDLFIEKNFNDFYYKFLKIRNMSTKEYEKYIFKFKSLPLFSFNNLI